MPTSSIFLLVPVFPQHERHYMCDISVKSGADPSNGAPGFERVPEAPEGPTVAFLAMKEIGRFTFLLFNECVFIRMK